jgi:hypothetical protein
MVSTPLGPTSRSHSLLHGQGSLLAIGVPCTGLYFHRRWGSQVPHRWTPFQSVERGMWTAEVHWHAGRGVGAAAHTVRCSLIVRGGLGFGRLHQLPVSPPVSPVCLAHHQWRSRMAVLRLPDVISAGVHPAHEAPRSPRL